MRSLMLAMLATTLLGCGGGGGSDEPRTAKLNLKVTDAPVDDAAEVWVQFSGIELQGPDGRLSETFTPPKKINLLAQSDGSTAALLSNFELTAGHYEWIRLQVDLDGELDTYLVDTNGLAHELDIPSGAQTGLKLNRGFDLAQGGTAHFTIDFDLRHSVRKNAHGYRLKPTLRLLDNSEIGRIVGTVSETLIASHCTGNATGVVYLYRNGIVPTIPDDIGGSGDQPITTANVKLDADNHYRFRIDFVETGLYTAAWTCDAASDDPEHDDALAFPAKADLEVRVGDTTNLTLQ